MLAIGPPMLVMPALDLWTRFVSAISRHAMSRRSLVDLEGGRNGAIARRVFKSSANGQSRSSVNMVESLALWLPWRKLHHVMTLWIAFSPSGALGMSATSRAEMGSSNASARCSERLKSLEGRVSQRCMRLEDAIVRPAIRSIARSGNGKSGEPAQTIATQASKSGVGPLRISEMLSERVAGMCCPKPEFAWTYRLAIGRIANGAPGLIGAIAAPLAMAEIGVAIGRFLFRLCAVEGLAVPCQKRKWSPATRSLATHQVA